MKACASKLESSLLRLAPKTDPSVKRCVQDDFNTKVCIVQQLALDGTYRSSSLRTIGCEAGLAGVGTPIAAIRAMGLSPDEILDEMAHGKETRVAGVVVGQFRLPLLRELGFTDEAILASIASDASIKNGGVGKP